MCLIAPLFARVAKLPALDLDSSRRVCIRMSAMTISPERLSVLFQRYGDGSPRSFTRVAQRDAPPKDERREASLAKHAAAVPQQSQGSAAAVPEVVGSSEMAQLATGNC